LALAGVLQHVFLPQVLQPGAPTACSCWNSQQTVLFDSIQDRKDAWKWPQGF
jgi:hypothetical protein